ncbi:Alpha/Beta hydrolase protein [Aspergillus pseudoustus]|uniref:Alpha/Beta hydrolase protein n=1 Tax=Aspergillus pseudoustus TaxID=1810923 RepID=A0ABR4KD71_9EURO
MFTLSALLTLVTATMSVAATAYTPPWTTIPATPELPHSYLAAHAPINNISLWYSLFGPPLGQAGSPVVLLHGGKISSRWWAHLIKSLSRDFSVIAIDTRAHGRSTDDLSVPLSYDQFAADAISLLDYLQIREANLVGWSDGAVTSLAIAMQYPARADRIVAFGANYNPNQANATGLGSITFGEDLYNREKEQYLELNPDSDPDFERFYERVMEMQSVSPLWDKRDFARIPVFGKDKDAPLLLVASGDYEEAILRTVPGEIHAMVSVVLRVCSWVKLTRGDSEFAAHYLAWR